jgi:hypothetical protein
MALKTLLRSGFIALACSLILGCSTKNLNVSEVVEKLSASGVTTATEGTMSPMVGGKGCLSATWLRIKGYQAMVLEYKDKETAHNAKFQVRNAVQSTNFLFAPPANWTEPLPPYVLSALQAALKIEK